MGEAVGESKREPQGLRLPGRGPCACDLQTAPSLRLFPYLLFTSLFVVGGPPQLRALGSQGSCTVFSCPTPKPSRRPAPSTLAPANQKPPSVRSHLPWEAVSTRARLCVLPLQPNVGYALTRGGRDRWLGAQFRQVAPGRAPSLAASSPSLLGGRDLSWLAAGRPPRAWIRLGERGTCFICFQQPPSLPVHRVHPEPCPG